ncbi:Uncharacterised protein [Mycobacterium tuberculosis]|nr:Uncharacterised protein [Mycobacterium tuberculosis]
MLRIGVTFRDHANAHQADTGHEHDRGGGGVRSAASLVALQAGHVRAAGQRANRQPRHPHLDPDLRGSRAAPTVEMVDPGPGALFHHVGLLHPAHRLYRGLRPAVRGEIPHPGHRPGGRVGLPAGLLCHRRLSRYHDLRHHPYPAQPPRDRSELPVLRIAQRRRVARPVDDLQRHLDLRVGPRLSGQQRHPALRQRGLPIAAIRRDSSPPRAARQRNHRNHSAVAAHRGHACVPDPRFAFQAPAHLPGAH